MTFLSQLEWRNAQKVFDSRRFVEDAKLSQIMKAIQLSPSSYGQQPYHVVVVSNAELKKQLRTVSWDQAQVEECSHLLVFCARADGVERVEEYKKAALEVPGMDEGWLNSYVDRVSKSLAVKQEQGGELLLWAQKQVYIALGFAMAACAELKIDSCPMEGIEAEKYDEILELPSHLQATVALPIGYRKEGEQLPKIRFGEGDLFSKKP